MFVCGVCTSDFQQKTDLMDHLQNTHIKRQKQDNVHCEEKQHLIINTENSKSKDHDGTKFYKCMHCPIGFEDCNAVEIFLNFFIILTFFRIF